MGLPPEVDGGIGVPNVQRSCNFALKVGPSSKPHALLEYEETPILPIGYNMFKSVQITIFCLGRICKTL